MRSSDFVNHSYDYRPNWTPLSPITIMNNCTTHVLLLPLLIITHHLNQLKQSCLFLFFAFRSGNTLETRGTAFVVYEDIFDAKNACDHLSGLNVCNRYLVVLYYQSTKVRSDVFVFSVHLVSFLQSINHGY